MTWDEDLCVIWKLELTLVSPALAEANSSLRSGSKAVFSPVLTHE